MKRIAQLLILLIIALLLIPIFLSRKIEAKVEREIDMPIGAVFNEFNNLNKFSKWENLTEADSLDKKEFYAPYQGQGAGYKWSKDTIVKGEFTIIKSTPDKLVEFEVEGFKLGKKSLMKAEFEAISPQKTKVIWSIDSDEIGYFSRYFSYFTTKNLNEKMTAGLEKLATQIKNEVLTSAEAGELKSGETRLEQFEGQKLIVVVNLTSLDQEEIKTATEESFGLLFSYLTDHLKIKQSELSNPISFYDYYDEGLKKAKFRCGYGIKESVKLGEGMELYSIPASETLVHLHKGSYALISESIQKMKNYAKEKKLVLGNSYWEEYLNDPEIVKNDAELLTKIYIPIKK
jgi:effector-binding domain-containing protein